MEASHQTFIDSLKDERIGGRYVVERVLRAGGMGVVVAGRYPELDQEVAIKFMLPELASHEILSVRFLREARLAARVKSPHFVRIFDFGRLNTSGSSVNASTGVPYLVMEMLSGRDLRDELEARGRLPVAEAIDYVLQAAVGIAEIHSLGFVHRDLKPSNLFLARAAGTLTVKVLDFGISKEAKQEGAQGLTSTGHLIGTAQYMAPEQIRESKVADVRSDVWALGVILYELMTLSLPFGADSNGVGEIMGLILHTEPVAPKKHFPEMPDGLQAVILKCLQREADDRYANVGELADALRPFAAPASLPRIDTIHHALESRPASPVAATPEPSTPPSEANLSIAVAHTVEAPTTAGASPGAKKASAPPQGGVHGVSSPSAPRETSMTSTGAARERLLKQSAPRTTTLSIVAGAVAVVAVVGGVYAFSSKGAPAAASGSPTLARPGPESSPSSSIGATAIGAAIDPQSPVTEPAATPPAPAETANTLPARPAPTPAGAAPTLPRGHAASSSGSTGPAAGAPHGRVLSAPSASAAHSTAVPANTGLSLDQLDRK